MKRRYVYLDEDGRCTLEHAKKMYDLSDEKYIMGFKEWLETHEDELDAWAQEWEDEIIAEEELINDLRSYR